MPPTITWSIAMPDVFSAWIAPIAISSLLEMTASNWMPADSQLVIRSVPWVRDHMAVCSSTISMKLHSSVAITSLMSWVRIRAAWLDSSPIITTAVAPSPLPASFSRRQISCVCRVPDSTSSDATKAWPSGSSSTLTGWRLT